jgi:hypothetical protein
MARHSRRGLLTSASAACGFGAIGAETLPSLRPEAAIIDFLRRAVPDLEMGEADLSAFAREIVARNGMNLPKRTAHFVLLGHGGAAALLPDGVAELQRRNEEQIITDFMRSTDYLDPGRGTAPTVYLGFADPYEAGCSNHLPGWLGAQDE